MKFPPFDYVAPSTVAEAVAAHSAEADDTEVKYLAGGQSLLPLMALRLARPTLLVDLQHVGLSGVTLSDGAGDGVGDGVAGKEVRIGAMSRHRQLETDATVRAAAPLVAEAASFIGHGAIRNLGTLGGSLAHADPAAELPAVAVALGARVTVVGPAGDREIAASDLAEGFFTTVLEPGELITSVTLPAAGPRSGASWCEWAPRAGDFAVAGAGVALELDDTGACQRVMAAVCGPASTPTAVGERLTSVAAGADAPSPSLSAKVAEIVRASVSSFGAAGDGAADQSADREDVAHLASLLAARAFHRAFERARSSAPAMAPLT